MVKRVRGVVEERGAKRRRLERRPAKRRLEDERRAPVDRPDPSKKRRTGPGLGVVRFRKKLAKMAESSRAERTRSRKKKDRPSRSQDQSQEQRFQFRPDEELPEIRSSPPLPPVPTDPEEQATLIEALRAAVQQARREQQTDGNIADPIGAAPIPTPIAGPSAQQLMLGPQTEATNTSHAGAPLTADEMQVASFGPSAPAPSAEGAQTAAGFNETPAVAVQDERLLTAHAGEHLQRSELPSANVEGPSLEPITRPGVRAGLGFKRSRLDIPSGPELFPHAKSQIRMTDPKLRPRAVKRARREDAAAVPVKSELESVSAADLRYGGAPDARQQAMFMQRQFPIPLRTGVPWGPETVFVQRGTGKTQKIGSRRGRGPSAPQTKTRFRLMPQDPGVPRRTKASA